MRIFKCDKCEYERPEASFGGIGIYKYKRHDGKMDLCGECAQVFDEMTDKWLKEKK